MRSIFRRVGSILTLALACAASTLPSCASMGGGGMRGMFSESGTVATQGMTM
jgi:hypothetical protein